MKERKETEYVEQFDTLSELFKRLEQIIDNQCERANDALVKSGKTSLEITCPHCQYMIKPFDWGFDEDKHIPLCPYCGKEISLPEGY